MSAVLSPSSLTTLPMFPLPDAVLFPGTALPLHVFESRYRALTRDAVAGDRLLAIARLRPGYEADYEGSPDVFDVVGVGRIAAHDELEDGRFNLLVEGIARARIERELPPDQPYRRIHATLIDDASSARLDEVPAVHAQLVALAHRIAGALEDEGAQLVELLTSIESPSRCADIAAAALVSDPDERQRLLSMPDPADRLDVVMQSLARLARSIAGDDPSPLH